MTTIDARMPDDPPVPDDGRCAVCRKPRPSLAVTHLDPFCSTECAKGWYALPYQWRLVQTIARRFPPRRRRKAA